MTWDTISKSIRTNIVLGLLLVTPLVVTLMIINFLFTFITDSLVPQAWLKTDLGLVYRLAALLLVVLGLYLMGLLIRNVIGQSLYNLGDRIMVRIPVIKSVYVAVQRVSESLISSKSETFKQVVAIQFPRLGVYSIGFLTARLPPDLARDAFAMSVGDEPVNVFVPCAPNPTSGFLLMVSRREITPLKINVADAMKMVVSMGAVLPTVKDAPAHSFLDHLGEWINHKPQGPKSLADVASAPSTPTDNPV
jgi:uncharacterized membrane protein